MPSKLYISTDGDIGLALKRNNNLMFNALSPEYLYSFPTYYGINHYYNYRRVIVTKPL